MSKVISFEESIVLWENDKNECLLNYSEHYEVKYEFQGDDGFWKKNVLTFCTSGKNNHDDVILEFKKRFPKANIISVWYC